MTQVTDERIAELQATVQDLRESLEVRDDQLLQLQRDLAAAREDAERYRWLFSDDGNSVIARVNKVWRQWDGESSWHSAIDAARSK